MHTLDEPSYPASWYIKRDELVAFRKQLKEEYQRLLATSMMLRRESQLLRDESKVLRRRNKASQVS
jgi:cell division protein FtsB